jgi:hypothetical protein
MHTRFSFDAGIALNAPYLVLCTAPTLSLRGRCGADAFEMNSSQPRILHPGALFLSLRQSRSGTCLCKYLDARLTRNVGINYPSARRHFFCICFFGEHEVLSPELYHAYE